jgi:exportin-1
MVDKILSDATYPQTKFLALQVLENVITTRWKVLPRDQCQGGCTLKITLTLKSADRA